MLACRVLLYCVHSCCSLLAVLCRNLASAFATQRPASRDLAWEFFTRSASMSIDHTEQIQA